jgi:hypothetical protein
MTDSNVPVQALNFLNPALVPASDPSKEVALACALLLCGIAVLESRRRRAR